MDNLLTLAVMIDIIMALVLVVAVPIVGSRLVGRLRRHCRRPKNFVCERGAQYRLEIGYDATPPGPLPQPRGCE